MKMSSVCSIVFSKALWSGIVVGGVVCFGASSAFYAAADIGGSGSSVSQDSNLNRSLFGYGTGVSQVKDTNFNGTFETIGRKSMDCFKEFFPGAPNVESAGSSFTDLKTHSVDTKVDSLLNQEVNGLKEVNLSDASIGCKKMSFSRTVDNHGFFYDSTITVKGNNWGLSLTSESTNINDIDKGKTISSFVLIFLKKKKEETDKWEIHKGYKWGLTFDIKDGRTNFRTTLPKVTRTKSSSKVAASWSSRPLTKKYLDILKSNKSYSSPFHWTKESFTGIWKQKDGGDKHLFDEGSSERWGIRHVFGADENKTNKDGTNKTEKTASEFFKTIQLTKKGEWKLATDYCAEASNGELDFCQVDIPRFK